MRGDGRITEHSYQVEHPSGWLSVRRPPRAPAGVSMPADELDGPVSLALEALDSVSARDLIGAARALEESRRDSLGVFRFARVFRAVAHDRSSAATRRSRACSFARP